MSIQTQDADDSDDDEEDKDDDEGDDSDEDGDESDDDEDAGEEDDTINMSSSMLAADSETSAMSEDASFQSSFSKKSFSTPKQGNAILIIRSYCLLNLPMYYNTSFIILIHFRSKSDIICQPFCIRPFNTKATWNGKETRTTKQGCYERTGRS